jgi:hypothetical protein
MIGCNWGVNQVLSKCKAEVLLLDIFMVAEISTVNTGKNVSDRPLWGNFS